MSWRPKLVALDIDGTLYANVPATGAVEEEISPAVHAAVHRATDAGVPVPDGELGDLDRTRRLAHRRVERPVDAGLREVDGLPLSVVGTVRIRVDLQGVHLSAGADALVDDFAEAEDGFVALRTDAAVLAEGKVLGTDILDAAR